VTAAFGRRSGRCQRQSAPGSQSASNLRRICGCIHPAADTLLLRRWPNGQRFTTSFEVANLGFVYSLALLF
jgi:hypothetical protein